MKKFLTIILSVLLAVTPAVLADSIPQGAAPGNLPPYIYMITSAYDICSDDGVYGGSRPDGFDLQSDGCLDLNPELRYEEYAFSGEQLIWEIVVRDLNGVDDISYLKLTVDGYTEALCEEITVGRNNPVEYPWTTQIPEKGHAPAEFDSAFDKFYRCVLTVEPSWYGESVVNVEAYDQQGAVSTDSISQSWFFNPAVFLDLDTNNGAPGITYEPGFPGETVFSENKLMVTNLAEGGVDLWAFIAADDLTDPTHSGAKCPVSNVLDVDGYGEWDGMDYRCKIGTMEDDTWRDITNKDNTDTCTRRSCVNANPLVMGSGQTSVIYNMKTAECQFKLQYPVPCIGDFSQGLIHIIVRAV